MCVYIVRASYSCHVPSEDTAVQQTFDGTNTYTDNMNEQMTFKKVLYSVRQQDTAWYYMIHEMPLCNPYSLLSKLPLSLRCRCLQVLVVLSRRRRSGLPMSKSPRKKNPGQNSLLQWHPPCNIHGPALSQSCNEKLPQNVESIHQVRN